MATFKINDRELQKLFKQLDQFEAKFVKKEVRKAIRKGLKPMLAAAKAEAPVETGALQAAIKIKAGKRKKGVISLEVQVGQQAFAGETFYGGMVEFGYRHPKSGEIIPPNPFMRRAFDQTNDQVVDIIKQELQQGVKRLAKEK